MFRSLCWVRAAVEIPPPLFMTMMSTGSSFCGRVLQIIHEAKSPSDEPASPPTTMVMPSSPCRFCTSAVPAAMVYWIAITDVTGTTFHYRQAKCPTKLRPIELGSVTVIAIWRMPSITGMPIATSAALLR